MIKNSVNKQLKGIMKDQQQEKLSSDSIYNS